VYGREICPTTGRSHLQGFINFTKSTAFGTAKRWLGEKAHLETARGNDKENQLYCSKDNAVVEYGSPGSQGKRSDLQLITGELLEHSSLKRVAEEHPAEFVRYHRGFNELIRVLRPPVDRHEKTALRVFIGLPGVGKSRSAVEGSRVYYETTPSGGEHTTPPSGGSSGVVGGGACETPPCYPTSSQVYYKPRGDWWDGYKQQPVVIIDDFYGWLKYDELLKISDRYPYRVPVKGSFETFNSKCIFITSNVAIDQWYHFNNYDPTALYRRCTEYVTINKDGTRTPFDVDIDF
jgi:hypothetical protein